MEIDPWVVVETYNITCKYNTPNGDAENYENSLMLTSYLLLWVNSFYNKVHPSLVNSPIVVLVDFK